MDALFILILLVALIAVLIAAVFLVLAILRRRRGTKTPHLKATRADKNPLIKPENEDWHTQGTFNPAAIQDSKGRVHMLYRAVGSDGLSRFSYAASDDGVHFTDKVPYPVFTMENPKSPEKKTWNPVMYPSGGSWGGAEDPRMVSIDGTIYVTFNAFDGWDFLRVALTSIKEDDFFNKRFKWTKPELLSPKGQIHKNWVLFPEKINGKFAILHSINPEIQIEYVDRLEEITKGNRVINSKFGAKKPRKAWDTWLRSAGPPPLKTPRGWLVLYHAVDKREPHKYKLGGLLLDPKNPTKIIARTPAPLLEPDMWYENDWKPGIVYACGAIIRKGELVVYYGGGDKYVCAARAPLNELLDWMLRNGKVS
ncbi:MAG TPA: hypothetical protein VFT82_03490 [Candidatus Paceibacterota bacterium]|nr:hypothetical protein [Candidatus Paceibacterota bacterium]